MSCHLFSILRYSQDSRVNLYPGADLTGGHLCGGRPLGGWVLETPGPRGPRKAKFWLAIAKS